MRVRLSGSSPMALGVSTASWSAAPNRWDTFCSVCSRTSTRVLSVWIVASFFSLYVRCARRICSRRSCFQCQCAYVMLNPQDANIYLDGSCVFGCLQSRPASFSYRTIHSMRVPDLGHCLGVLRFLRFCLPGWPCLSGPQARDRLAVYVDWVFQNRILKALRSVFFWLELECLLR